MSNLDIFLFHRMAFILAILNFVLVCIAKQDVMLNWNFWFMVVWALIAYLTKGESR